MENQIQTAEHLKVFIDECFTLRRAKRKDYGSSSWKILRPSSMTDQLFIKAKRIRSIQEKGENKVGDPIDKEFMGLINYSFMGLYQLKMKGEDTSKQSPEEEDEIFQTLLKEVEIILEKKNHDYGEAWRDLRIFSIVDFILAKLLRLREIESNKYKVAVSEPAEASYHDIIIYSVFCLILMKEGADPMVL